MRGPDARRVAPPPAAKRPQWGWGWGAGRWAALCQVPLGFPSHTLGNVSAYWAVGLFANLSAWPSSCIHTPYTGTQAAMTAAWMSCPL